MLSSLTRVRSGLLLAVALMVPAASLTAQSGSLDPSFGGSGVVVTDADPDGWFHAVAVQADGKVVAAGVDRFNGTQNDVWLIARFATDGTLDPSFGTGGKLTLFGMNGGGDRAQDVALDASGRILVTGLLLQDRRNDLDFCVVRLTANGALDPSFGSGGVVTTDVTPRKSDVARAVAVQADGRIVVAGHTQKGTTNAFALVRYLPNGSLDATFGSGGIRIDDYSKSQQDEVSYGALCLQDDGKIVIGGRSGAIEWLLARYLANGQTDQGFGSQGKVLGSFSGLSSPRLGDIAFDSALGCIVAAGRAYHPTRSFDALIARYTVNGLLDPSFDADGWSSPELSAEDHGFGLTIQPDGKYVVCGTILGATADLLVFRFLGNGSPDVSFGAGGLGQPVDRDQDFGNAVAVAPDGRIVVAGRAGSMTPMLPIVARWID